MAINDTGWLEALNIASDESAALLDGVGDVGACITEQAWEMLAKETVPLAPLLQANQIRVVTY